MPSPKDILVSVVIPVYNIEKYIAQTLESVIGQTHHVLEIIVVNDGSTDGTLAIAQTYAQKDSRISIINQHNKGLAAARNSGLSRAAGEYVCIIDADDIMMPNKIESQLTFLHSRPHAQFTYSKVHYFSNETNQLYIHDLPTPDGAHVFKTLLKKGNVISPNSVFFKRNLFTTIGGFDETLRSAEDLDYWLFLSSHGVSFIHQNEYLTLCRARSDSLTADNITLYTCAVRVFEKYLTGMHKLFSYQYRKNKLLLFLAKLRKQKKGGTNGRPEHATEKNIRWCINYVYQFLRKIKFFLTFQKVYDTRVHDHLLSIESRVSHEPTR